ncbi:serine hydrolase domain-containing protein [Nonomuraea sp. NPDC050556]|uniref:serine hydrolase domain-containing protein n=1 Tax=Nonomuraea sp. NPDC050556 TaxID=3364369 RepID=UPI0037A1CB71
MDLELVEQALADLSPDAPGLAVGVYSDGKVLRTAARGAASVEFGVPIDEHTRFDIASISKQFTATCLLLLARDGKLSLSDDVRTHVPELALEVPVTLRQCLQHTGGLPEWYSLQALTGVPFKELSEDRLMRIISRLRRTTFEPGTEFSYSNTGYVLAAVVVRRVSGQSLAEFAKERLFGPLGMHDTFFRDDTSLPAPRMAYGYNGAGRRADSEESAVGDGGVVTSVSDLAPWFGFLKDGGPLGADLLEALLERTVLADGTELRYALGICHQTVGDLAGYGHAGGMHGYVSNLVYLPGPGVGVALLTNHSGLDPVPRSVGVARALTGQEPAPQPVLSSDGEEKRVALLGCWQDPASRATLTLEPSDLGEIAMSGPAVPSCVLALGEDGRWHGQGDARGYWVALEGERLLLGHVGSIRWPTEFTSCAPPGDAALPEGSWLSDELGVLAVHEDGVLSVGLTLAETVAPGPAGEWRAGSATLRLDGGGDLLISAHGLRDMRFVRQPIGTAPVGIPPGLRD